MASQDPFTQTTRSKASSPSTPPNFSSTPSKSAVQAALQDIFINTPSPPPDDDIPEYYQTSYSPTEKNYPPIPVAKDSKKSKSSMDKMRNGKKGAVEGKGTGKKKGRSGAPLDFIDTLDTIGGFHHDGPFDAASTHRNRTTSSRNPARQAPIHAFDPSALSPETALRSTARPSPSRPSARAQAAMQAMDDKDHLSPYANGQTGPNGHSYPPSLSRKSSDGSLHSLSMGYPAGKIARDPKAAQLAEAFGIQDSEAWEDYGRTRGGAYRRPRGDDGDGTGEESGSEKAVGREERNLKAASVWDMEATLQAGRPVGSSANVPPVPALPPMPFLSHTTSPPTHLPRSSPAYLAPMSDNYTPPKRSKSLMQRIKKGVRSPGGPTTGAGGAGGGEDGEGESDEVGEMYQPSRPGQGRHHSSKSLSAAGGLSPNPNGNGFSGGSGGELKSNGSSAGDGWKNVARDEDGAMFERAQNGNGNGNGGGFSGSASGGGFSSGGNEVGRKPSLLQKIGFGKNKGR